MRWVVGMSAGYCNEFATVMTWVCDNWTEERSPLFGMMFYESAAGRDMLESTKYLAEMGAEFAGHEVGPMIAALDTSTELLRLAGKKPDWICVISAGSTATTLVKDAARLEIQEKGIRLVGMPSTIDESTLAIVGEDAEGWYIYHSHAVVGEADVPGVQAFYEVERKYRGLKPEELTTLAVRSWFGIQVAVEGIRLAIEKVGFENLNGRAVRDALFSIKDFDTGELLPPVTITEGRPYLNSSIRIYQVRPVKGQAVTKWLHPVTDWIKVPYRYAELGE